MLQGEPSQGIFAIAQFRHGIIAVGGDYTKLEQREKHAFIYRAATFQVPSATPLGYRSGVVFWKKHTLAVAVGPSGSDCSYDAGMTWENFSSIGYHAVKVSNDQKAIWASGSDGRIGVLVN